MFDRNKPLVRELFERNQRTLLSYLTRKVGRDTAPDLLQDAFVRVLRHGQLEAVTNPAALLQQIAVNLVRDFARRRKTESAYVRYDHFLVDPPSDEASLEDKLEYNRKSRLLDHAIDLLPPRCREVFELCIDDIPVTEIAKRLGISERMVRKHLSVAMQHCRSALD
ncbi:MAG TPA: RNA polymerase sigma factor [Methylocella sp.]|nr:RNA polymerase sigma factor [Methylocella sp.]